MIDIPLYINNDTTLDDFGQLWFWPPTTGSKSRYLFSGDNPNRPSGELLAQVFWVQGVIIDHSFDDVDCMLMGLKWLYTLGEYWYWGFAIPSSDKRYVGEQVLPNNRSLSCVFVCPYGYYISNIQNMWGVTLCKSCHDDCYECLGPLAHDCISCKYKKHYLLTDLVRSPQLNGTCTDNSCLTNEYFKFNSCHSCNLNCSSCNEYICLSCSDGYYLDGVNCNPCPRNCKTCINYSTCISCSNPYVNHTLSYSLPPQTMQSSNYGTLLSPSLFIEYNCLSPNESVFPLHSSTAIFTSDVYITVTANTTQYLNTTITSLDTATHHFTSVLSSSFTTSIQQSSTVTLLCTSQSVNLLTNIYSNMTIYSTIQNNHPTIVIVNYTNSDYYEYNYDTIYQSIYLDQCQVNESHNAQSFVYDSENIPSTAVSNADKPQKYYTMRSTDSAANPISNIANSYASTSAHDSAISYDLSTASNKIGAPRIKSTLHILPDSIISKTDHIASYESPSIYFVGTAPAAITVAPTPSLAINAASVESSLGLPSAVIAILAVMSALAMSLLVFLVIWSRKSYKKHKIHKNTPVVPIDKIIKNFEEFKIPSHLIKPLEVIAHVGIYEIKRGKLLLDDNNKIILIKSLEKVNELIFIEEVEMACKLGGVVKIHQFIGYCETPNKNLIIYEHYELTLYDWFLSSATNLLKLTDYEHQVKQIIPQIITGITALHAKKQYHGNIGLHCVYIMDINTMRLVVGEIRIKPIMTHNDANQPLYARYLNSKIVQQFNHGLSYRYGEMDDLFAFGILLYEIVHGERAYGDFDLSTTLKKIENKEYPLYTMQLYEDTFKKCCTNSIKFKDLNK
eukprot:NODE_81_length_22753_cov_0.207072.p2 type:complete len:845 gc:universal NODE_81_length_22753_cov_0.207072:8087-5553(-)